MFGQENRNEVSFLLLCLLTGLRSSCVEGVHAVTPTASSVLPSVEGIPADHSNEHMPMKNAWQLRHCDFEKHVLQPLKLGSIEGEDLDKISKEIDELSTDSKKAGSKQDSKEAQAKALGHDFARVLRTLKKCKEVYPHNDFEAIKDAIENWLIKLAFVNYQMTLEQIKKGMEGVQDVITKKWNGNTLKELRNKAKLSSKEHHDLVGLRNHLEYFYQLRKVDWVQPVPASATRKIQDQLQAWGINKDAAEVEALKTQFLPEFVQKKEFGFDLIILMYRVLKEKLPASETSETLNKWMVEDLDQIRAEESLQERMQQGKDESQTKPWYTFIVKGVNNAPPHALWVGIGLLLLLSVILIVVAAKNG